MARVMKLYAFYSASHEILKDNWFIPSLQDNFELKLERCDQECLSGNYKTEGWKKAMLQKCDLVLEAIERNRNVVFVYSDVDIQFFKPVQNVISRFMVGKDMAFQTDSPQGGICAGFFACRGNLKTQQLWQEIRTLLLQAEKGIDDQDILNRLLLGQADFFSKFVYRVRSLLKLFLRGDNDFPVSLQRHLNNPYRVRWTYFSVNFFGGGTLTGQHWKPGMPLEIPKNILLHHANWTTGIENKIAQLEWVRRAAKIQEQADQKS